MLFRSFTPAAVLKFTLKEKQPEHVLARLKSLLEQLAGEQQAIAPTPRSDSPIRLA